MLAGSPASIPVCGTSPAKPSRGCPLTSRCACGPTFRHCARCPSSARSSAVSRPAAPVPASASSTTRSRGNHAHLIVEARDRDALGRGMKAIGARLARAVNRIARRKGPVLDDPLPSPVAAHTQREAHTALRYVLLNARRHAREGRYYADERGAPRSGVVSALVRRLEARCARYPARPAGQDLSSGRRWRERGRGSCRSDGAATDCFDPADVPAEPPHTHPLPPSAIESPAPRRRGAFK